MGSKGFNPLQILTPDQTKAVLGVLKWSGDHVIIPIAIWGYHRAKISIKAAKQEIVAQISSNVEVHTSARIAAHEISDAAAFMSINTRLGDIEATLRVLTPPDPGVLLLIRTRLDAIEVALRTIERPAITLP